MKKIIFLLLGVAVFSFGTASTAFANAPKILSYCAAGFETDWNSGTFVYSASLSTPEDTMYKNTQHDYYLHVFADGTVDYTDVLASHAGEPWYKSHSGVTGTYFTKDSKWLSPSVGHIVAGDCAIGTASAKTVAVSSPATTVSGQISSVGRSITGKILSAGIMSNESGTNPKTRAIALAVLVVFAIILFIIIRKKRKSKTTTATEPEKNTTV